MSSGAMPGVHVRAYTGSNIVSKGVRESPRAPASLAGDANSKQVRLGPVVHRNYDLFGGMAKDVSPAKE